MNKLLVLFEATHHIKFLLDEILHSFHVVIRHLLDVLHPLGISRRKLTIDVTKLIEQSMINCLQLRQRQFTKRNEILYFYTYAIPDKGIL